MQSLLTLPLQWQQLLLQAHLWHYLSPAFCYCTLAATINFCSWYGLQTQRAPFCPSIPYQTWFQAPISTSVSSTTLHCTPVVLSLVHSNPPTLHFTKPEGTSRQWSALPNVPASHSHPVITSLSHCSSSKKRPVIANWWNTASRCTNPALPGQHHSPAFRCGLPDS